MSQDDCKEFGVFWGATLLEGAPEKEPIVENFIYVNDVVFICADAGTGKSILVLQLASHVTTGEPFLGTYRVCKPGNVLYVQTEGDRGETIARLQAMSHGVKMDYSKFIHINLPGLALNTEQGFKEFMKEASKPGLQYSLIIIDPLYTTVKGSLSSDEVATDWIRNVRGVKDVFGGCGIVVSAHDTKDILVDGLKVKKDPAVIFGSVYWKAWANYNYRFEWDKHKGIHTLELGKRRTNNTPDVLVLKMVEPVPLMFKYSEDDMTVPKNKIMAALRTHPEGCNPKHLIDVGISKATFYRVIKQLMEERLVEKTSLNKHDVRYKIIGGTP